MDDAELMVTIPSPHYVAWLQDWNTHMDGVSTSLLVPAAVHLIQTPLVLYLSKHKPSKDIHLNPLAAYFLTVITFGFCVSYVQLS